MFLVAQSTQMDYVLAQLGQACLPNWIMRKCLPPLEVAERLIFRERTKLATSADQCSLKPVTGIAREFDARRRSPPHNYSIVAPTARKNYVQCFAHPGG